jgi:hypothetical protein
MLKGATPDGEGIFLTVSSLRKSTDSIERQAAAKMADIAGEADGSFTGED